MQRLQPFNNVTRPDPYTLPKICDFTNKSKGCTVFSKLDLVKGYHQVPKDPGDICKTAIVTPFGLSEFLSMPFGLKNTAQTFQPLMNQIFRGLPYILFKNFNWKPYSGCDWVSGHMVTPSIIVPLCHHVDILLLPPHPHDVHGLQRFLGMVNFYWCFLSGTNYEKYFNIFNINRKENYSISNDFAKRVFKKPLDQLKYVLNSKFLVFWSFHSKKKSLSIINKHLRDCLILFLLTLNGFYWALII